MEFKQKTNGDLIESERLMVLTAPQRFGAYYTLALDASVFLSVAVKSIDQERASFVRFLSQVKTQHRLAVFSTVRLHQIQAMMNLRLVLEAGACAAFAIANPDPAHFANTTPEGTFKTSQKLNAKRHEWLDMYFPQASSYIKEMKGHINNSTAHANIVYTHNTFRVADSGDEFSTPFFDIENEYFVRVDLWKASEIAILLIDLFYQVNKDVNAIVWRDDFDTLFSALIERVRVLKSEMLSSDLFKETE